MTRKKLSRKFFDRPTLRVAKELLGKFLVRKIPSTSSGQAAKKIVAMITETEAYCGPHDLASHASRGRTPRTEVMFGHPGRAYIYLIYGMYYCFNIVTEREEYPAAVLIRAVGVEGINGPGKLCRHFQIDKTLNKEDVVMSKKLWLEDRGINIKPNRIRRVPRVGVDYAGSYKNKLWRFFLS